MTQGREARFEQSLTWRRSGSWHLGCHRERRISSGHSKREDPRAASSRRVRVIRPARLLSIGQRATRGPGSVLLRRPRESPAQGNHLRAIRPRRRRRPVPGPSDGRDRPGSHERARGQHSQDVHGPAALVARSDGAPRYARDGRHPLGRARVLPRLERADPEYSRHGGAGGRAVRRPSRRGGIARGQRDPLGYRSLVRCQASRRLLARAGGRGQEPRARAARRLRQLPFDRVSRNRLHRLPRLDCRKATRSENNIRQL